VVATASAGERRGVEPARATPSSALESEGMQP
jgi:hypothetical protein